MLNVDCSDRVRRTRECMFACASVVRWRACAIEWQCTHIQNWYLGFSFPDPGVLFVDWHIRGGWVLFRLRPSLGRLPEMTRLRRKGPVNDFVDKDPLKQWVSACVAVCRNGSPFPEKERKKCFFYGGRGGGVLVHVSTISIS